MSSVRSKLFRDLSKNLQHVGIAMFALAGALTVKAGDKTIDLNIFILLAAIGGVVLVVFSAVLLVLAAREDSKNRS